MYWFETACYPLTLYSRDINDYNNGSSQEEIANIVPSNSPRYDNADMQLYGDWVYVVHQLAENGTKLTRLNKNSGLPEAVIFSSDPSFNVSSDIGKCRGIYIHDIKPGKLPPQRVKVRSHYTATALRYRTAPYTAHKLRF